LDQASVGSPNNADIMADGGAWYAAQYRDAASNSRWDDTV